MTDTEAVVAVPSVNHNHQLIMTPSLLARSQAVVEGWRKHVAEWSRCPSRPIPTSWRSTLVDALDDDLDVARVVAMMSELEEADDVEPGAKFEAFAYADRILAADLMRNLCSAPVPEPGSL